LLRQKKVTKEKAAPMPLWSCAPKRLEGGAWRGIPAPASNVRHPCRTPSGKSRQTFRCSARHQGKKTTPHLTVISFRYKNTFPLVTKLQLGYPNLESSSFLNIGSNSFQDGVPKLEFGNEKNIRPVVTNKPSPQRTGFIPLCRAEHRGVWTD